MGSVSSGSEAVTQRELRYDQSPAERWMSVTSFGEKVDGQCAIFDEDALKEGEKSYPYVHGDCLKMAGPQLSLTNRAGQGPSQRQCLR